MEGYNWIIIAFVGLLIGILARNMSKLTRFIPYSVFLLIIGFSIGSISVVLKDDSFFIDSVINMNPHIFMQIFLPNLIFYSVFCINYHTILNVIWMAIILAGPGVVINSILTMIITSYILPYRWDWKISLLFGAIVSATDPVAVVTLLKEIKASLHLATLIEAESLFNDASAIVIFTLLLKIIGDPQHSNTLAYYVKTTALLLAAPFIGFVFGLITIWWIFFIFNDEILETSITFVSANLVFLLSETVFQSSGVLSTVCLGLVIVRYKANISPKSIVNLEHFWELLEYFAKTLIFIISGVIVSIKTLKTHSIVWADLGYLFLIYVWIHLTRAISLLILFPLLRCMDSEYTWKTQTVLWYGSLRGAIGLALALIVEHVDAINETDREKIVFHICGIVILTLLINGTTMQYLLKILNIKGSLYLSDFLIRTSLNHLKSKSAKLLRILTQNNHFSGANWTKVRDNLPNYNMLLKTDDYKITTEMKICESSIRYRFICSMKSFYRKQHFDGMITTHAYNILSNAAEIAIDKDDIEAQWDSIRMHFKIPKFFICMSQIRFLRSLTNRFMYDRIFLAVQLSAAFIFASDRMGIIVNTFPEWKVDELKRVEMELQQVEKKAHYEWHNIQKTYPEVYQAIQTRNAAVFILNKDIHNIHSMKKEGIIQDSECEEMIVNIDHMLHKMKISLMVDYNVDCIAAFTNLPFIHVLDKEKIQSFFDKTNYKIYSGDDYLYREGGTTKGFFVIIRGLVEISKESKTIAIYGPGSIVNLWSGISNNPSITTSKCLTAVTVLKISTNLCLDLMKEKQSNEILWKCAGFLLCRLLFAHQMDATSDQFRLGEICLTSTLHLINGEALISYDMLLLKGKAINAMNIYIAPALIRLNTDLLTNTKDMSKCITIFFYDAVVLLFDGNGGPSSESISEIAVNLSQENEDESPLDRQESLGLIYIKGSAESNRTKLSGMEANRLRMAQRNINNLIK